MFHPLSSGSECISRCNIQCCYNDDICLTLPVSKTGCEKELISCNDAFQDNYTCKLKFDYGGGVKLWR